MLTFLSRSGREVKGKGGHCEMLLRALCASMSDLWAWMVSFQWVSQTARPHPYPAHYFISNTFNEQHCHACPGPAVPFCALGAFPTPVHPKGSSCPVPLPIAQGPVRLWL